MKKLALVTLLAVAASWLLSETGPPTLPAPTEPVTAYTIHRTAQAPEPPTPPEAPRAPEAPAPPEAIRSVPWRKAEPGRSKSRRTATTRTATPATPATPASPPDWFPRSDAEKQARALPDAEGYRVLVGQVSVSEDRARQDLRTTLEREVSRWIAADVPPTWKPPAPLIDRMVRGSYVQKLARDLKPSAVGSGRPSAPEAEAGTEAETPSGLELPELENVYTLYQAGQRVDFSASRKARVIETYRKDLATQRMQRLGGGLALSLGLLAVMAGYIRADEATRGYYTNRLRLAAVAGLGAAGVAAYRFLS